MKFHRGDIVKVNLNPTQGHEQGEFRPVLVMNDVPLPGGVNIILPITTKQKTYPLEVALDERTKTRGVVLCFQIRTIDLQSRGAKIVEKAPDDLVRQCSEFGRRLTDSMN